MLDNGLEKFVLDHMGGLQFYTISCCVYLKLLSKVLYILGHYDDYVTTPSNEYFGRTSKEYFDDMRSQ